MTIKQLRETLDTFKGTPQDSMRVFVGIEDLDYQECTALTEVIFPHETVAVFLDETAVRRLEHKCGSAS